MPQIDSTAYITSGGINENVEDYWGYIYEEYGDGFLLESQVGIPLGSFSISKALVGSSCQSNITTPSKVGSASRTILGNSISTSIGQVSTRGIVNNYITAYDTNKAISSVQSSTTSASATTYLNSLNAVPSITSGLSIGIGNKSLFGVEALTNYGSVSARIDVIRTLNNLPNKVASFSNLQAKGESSSHILGVNTISSTSSLERVGNSSKNLTGILLASSQGIVDTLSETNIEISGLNTNTTLSILNGKGSSNTTPESIEKGINSSQPSIEAKASCLIQPLQIISQVAIPNTFADGIKELVGLNTNSLSNSPTINISSNRTIIGQLSEILLGQINATGELSGVANLIGNRVFSSVERVSCQGLGQTNLPSTLATSSISALRAFGETHISSLVEVRGITSDTNIGQLEPQGNAETSLSGFAKQITQNSSLSFGEALVEVESRYLTKNVGRVSSFNFDLDSARYEVSIIEEILDIEMSLDTYRTTIQEPSHYSGEIMIQAFSTSIDQVSHQASIESLEEYSGDIVPNQYSIDLEDTQAQFSSIFNTLQFSTDIVGQSLTTDIRI